MTVPHEYVLPVVLPHRALNGHEVNDGLWANMNAPEDDTYAEGMRRAKWRFLDRELNARQAERLPALD